LRSLITFARVRFHVFGPVEPQSLAALQVNSLRINFCLFQNFQKIYCFFKQKALYLYQLKR